MKREIILTDVISGKVKLSPKRQPDTKALKLIFTPNGTKIDTTICVLNLGVCEFNTAVKYLMELTARVHNPSSLEGSKFTILLGKYKVLEHCVRKGYEPYWYWHSRFNIVVTFVAT